MRSPDEVRLVQRLAAEGRSKAAIVRATGIPYRTISHWLNGRAPNFDKQSAKCADDFGCPRDQRGDLRFVHPSQAVSAARG